jgi:hypothetical protein
MAPDRKTLPIVAREMTSQSGMRNTTMRAERGRLQVLRSSRVFVRFAARHRVLTYDPESRLYYVGEIAGPYEYRASDRHGHLPHTRRVKWVGGVARDALSPDTKNTLGSMLTIYKPNDDAAADIRSLLSAKSPRQTSTSQVLNSTMCKKLSLCHPSRTLNRKPESL